MKKLLPIFLLALLSLAGCNSVDNKVLPGFTVRLDLGTYGLWNTYGVKSAGDYVIFNRDRRLPASFPYNANTYTGFGGVLLIMGFDAATAAYTPLAFDAACPVERRADVTLSIDNSNFDAVWPLMRLALQCAPQALAAPSQNSPFPKSGPHPIQMPPVGQRRLHHHLLLTLPLSAIHSRTSLITERVPA